MANGYASVKNEFEGTKEFIWVTSGAKVQVNTDEDGNLEIYVSDIDTNMTDDYDIEEVTTVCIGIQHEEAQMLIGQLVTALVRMPKESE